MRFSLTSNYIKCKSPLEIYHGKKYLNITNCVRSHELSIANIYRLWGLIGSL